MSLVKCAQKRVFDIIVSLALLLLLWPILAILPALIRHTSPGPAIFKQRRIGYRGKPFTIIKLRTMEYEPDSVFQRCVSPTDPRVTPLGKVLRLSHLDELPQLWNVLRGDISLVGPRPREVSDDHTLSESVPNYRHRCKIKPGLTGPGRLWAPNNIEREVALDLAYASQPFDVGRDLYYISLTWKCCYSALTSFVRPRSKVGSMR